MVRDLAKLAGAEHDLLVVGGGISGAAAAWDAAQRGLAVALVEANDFCSGTSWNSLKTIHGGLRHLQRADLAGLRESMRERRALLRIAPALVRPLPVLVPAYGHGPRGREALALGVRLSDLLSLDRNRGLPREQWIPPGRVLSPRQVEELVPGLPAARLSGGVVFWDAQVESSERLVLAFLHAAASAGAALANHVEVTGLLRSGGRVAGARARDTMGGGELELRARVVLNCAGPAADRILELAGIRREPVPLLWAMNLVLARRVAGSHAVAARAGGRFLFLVPWRGRSIVGTDYAVPGSDRDGDVDGFRREAARAFPWAGIEPGDVTLVHRGLVPGRGDASGLLTRSLLVDHQTADGLPGLLSVVAAKYTTARALAERAVDRVFLRLGRPCPPCRTASTPLPRAGPLPGPLDEQARLAVREEMALSLGDAVLRRLDLGTAGPPDEDDLRTCLRTLGAELGWDETRASRERAALMEAYRA